MEEEKKNESIEEYPEQQMQIPIDGRNRTVTVQKIPIVWEGKQEEVVIRRLGHGERASLTDKFSKLVMINKKESRPDYSYEKLVMNSMLMAIVRAPFPVTHDYIYYDLSPKIGAKIYKAIEKLNNMDEEEAKKSDGQSETEQKTED